MKRCTVALAVLCAALCFQGCTPAVTEAVQKSGNLRVSMTKAEVLKIMGTPLQDETFCKPDVWYYFAGQVWADGLVTEDECLPLVFENGKLAGWGMDFYARYRILVENEKKKSLKDKVDGKIGKTSAEEKPAEKTEEKTDKK